MYEAPSTLRKHSASAPYISTSGENANSDSILLAQQLLEQNNSLELANAMLN